MNELRRVALVTGASGGIGRAVALRLGSEGYRLALLGRRESVLAETARQLSNESLVHVADVAERDRMFEVVEETVDVFGRLDVLVNAAGILFRESALDHSLDTWRRTMATNLDGPFWLAQAFVRTLLASGRAGAIGEHSLGRGGLPAEESHRVLGIQGCSVDAHQGDGLGRRAAWNPGERRGCGCHRNGYECGRPRRPWREGSVARAGTNGPLWQT